MRIAAVAAAALVLAVSSIAAAQPAMTAPSPPPDVAYSWAPPPPDAKSESTATMLAVGSTAAGYVLAISLAPAAGNTEVSTAVAGLIVVGPSAGHLYAGETGHALGMSALRTAGVVTFAVGLIGSLGVAQSSEQPCMQPCTSTVTPDGIDYAARHRDFELAMVAGAGVFIGGTIYDLVDAHRAAARANERARTRQLAVVPVLSRGADGNTAGIALAGHW